MPFLVPPLYIVKSTIRNTLKIQYPPPTSNILYSNLQATLTLPSQQAKKYNNSNTKTPKTTNKKDFAPFLQIKY